MRAAAAAILIFAWVSAGLGASSSIRVSHFVNFEGGSNGEVINDANSDTNTWNSFTFGTSPGGWERVITGGSGHMTIDTSMQTALLKPITLAGGGTYYETNSTRAFKMDDSATQRELMRYWFPTAKSKVSWGFFWKGNSWTQDGNSYDMVSAEQNDGGFICFQFYNDASFFTAAVETQNTPQLGATVNITKNKLYWVTMQADAPNQIAKIFWYDPVTWLKVGQSTNAIANSNVRFLTIGRYDDHQHAPAGSAHWVENFVVDDTGANFPMFPASAWVTDDASYTQVNGAYTSASANDTIVIPCATNTWSNQGFDVAKAGLLIEGFGGSNKTVINFTQTGSANCPLRPVAAWIRVGGIQWVGPSGQDNLQACAIQADTGGLWWRVHDCLFVNCFVRSIDPFGVCYKCAFADGDRMGRVAGDSTGQTNYDCCFPFDPASTNKVVFEDDIFNTTSALVTSALVAVSAQQGHLYMVRNCTFNFAKGDIAPVFDSHGPTGPDLRGSIGIVIASNIVNFTGSGTWSELVDIRGGAALVYSNKVTGSPGANIIKLRRHTGDAGLYFQNGGVEQVSNVFLWANFNGSTPLTPSIDSADSNIIVLHLSFETNEPPAFDVATSVPPYPFPVRHDAAAQQGGPQSGKVRGKLGRASAGNVAP